MDHVTKRARLGLAPYDLGDEDEDEITMDPEEFAIKQDPQYQLELSRAASDNKLKSAFEKLFEKYGKDFADTGDEINFYTDEIEVDNGHIASLPNAALETSISLGAIEQSVGGQSDNDGDGDGDESDGVTGQDEERILHGDGGSSRPPVTTAMASSQALVPRQASSALSRWPMAQESAGSRLSNLLPSRTGLMSRSLSFGAPFASAFGPFSALPTVFHQPADPAWAVPDLPEIAFQQHYAGGALTVPAYNGNGMSHTVPTRKVLRRLLPVPAHSDGTTDGDDGDDEDDLILGIVDDSAFPPPPTKSKDASPSGGAPARKVTMSTLRQGLLHSHQSRSPRPKKGLKRPPSEGGKANGVTTVAQEPTATEGRDDGPQKDTAPPAETVKGGRQTEAELTKPPKRPRSPATERVDDSINIKKKRKKRKQQEPQAEEETPLEQHYSPLRQLCESTLVVEISSRVPPSLQMKLKLQDTLGADSLPTPPPGEDGSEAGSEETNKCAPSRPPPEKYSEASTPNEYFSRNVLDPSYAFSDEEENGLSWRKKPPPNFKTVTVPPDQEAEQDKESERGGHEMEARTRKDMESDVQTEHRAAPILIVSSPVRGATASVAKAKATLATQPSTPQPKTGACTPRSHRGQHHLASGSLSRQRSSIVLLVSDDSADEDEDELSWGPDDFTPSGTHHRARNDQSMLSSGRRLWPPARAVRTVAASAAQKKRSMDKVRVQMPFSSPLMRKHGFAHGFDSAPSPNGSVIQTPGGTKRRCGQDGFKCDRDFCFRCL